MPRQSNIRWRKADELELKRVVQNYNRKIARIIKKDPTLAEYMPSRATVSNLKKDIVTRADFNRELNSLKRFLVRGAEKVVTSKGGIKTTEWEKKEVGIMVATINRKRSVKRKEMGELTATTRGKALNFTRSQMIGARLDELKPKIYNFDKIDKYGWESYKRGVKKQVKSSFQSEADLNLRKNYIVGLKNVFGETSETEALIRDIENMSIEQFIKKFYSEQEADIDFIYDPIENQRKLDILKETVWNEIDSPDRLALNKPKSKKYKRKKNTKKKKV